MTELELKLQAKAQRVLFNPSEVSPEVVVLSLKEAIELTDNKPIKETLLLDLALLRLKENLKIELSEYEQKCVFNIIKKAEAISIDEVSQAVNHTIAFGRRPSEWEL